MKAEEPRNNDVQSGGSTARGSRTAVIVLSAMLAIVLLDAAHPGDWTYRWVPMLGALGTGMLLIVSPPVMRRAVLGVLYPLLALLALMGVYALNPTHRFEAGLGLVPVNSLPGLPGAADALRARAAWMLALAAGAVFIMGACVSGRDRLWLQGVILVAGGLMGAVVLHQRLLPEQEYLAPSGVFTSRNHYAAYANLLVPVTLASATRFQYRAIAAGAVSSPACPCYMIAAILVASILMSGSRAGLALVIASLALWLLVRLRLTLRYGRSLSTPAGWRIGITVLIFLVVASGVLLVALPELAGWRVARDVAFRLRVLRDTLAVWRDNPWWGTGPGTFVSVFPYYQSEAIAGLTFIHAHHEPAQTLAEFGVLGGGFALTAVLLAMRRVRRIDASGDHWPARAEVEAPGFGIALAVVMLHGLVDFPFRSPVILLISALWCSRLCVDSRATNRDFASGC